MLRVDSRVRDSDRVNPVTISYHFPIIIIVTYITLKCNICYIQFIGV